MVYESGTRTLITKTIQTRQRKRGDAIGVWIWAEEQTNDSVKRRPQGCSETTVNRSEVRECEIM